MYFETNNVGLYGRESFHKKYLSKNRDRPPTINLAKWVWLAPNGTNVWLVKIIFQYNLARWAKINWKKYFPKSQICPILGPNVTSLPSGDSPRCNVDTRSWRDRAGGSLVTSQSPGLAHSRYSWCPGRPVLWTRIVSQMTYSGNMTHS